MPMPPPMDRALKTEPFADESISDSSRPVPNPDSSKPVPNPDFSAAPHSPSDLDQLHASRPSSEPTEVAAKPNTGDRRAPREDRRDREDRRSNSLRRGRDRQRNATAKQIAYLGTVLCALSVAISIYAFLKAPITFSPSPACNDGFGGQRIEHRGLSSLWAVVMVLAAAGLVIPDHKRRPVVLMILCGVSLGLFAGAYFTVGSKFDGLCLV